MFSNYPDYTNLSEIFNEITSIRIDPLPNVHHVVFSLFQVLYWSPLCAVSWQTIVSPLVRAAPKLKAVGALAECSSVQDIWIPDAKGLTVLGVYCNAMQPLCLS